MRVTHTSRRADPVSGPIKAAQLLREGLRRLTLRKHRRRWRDQRRMAQALARLERFPRHPDAPRHTLPAQLIISLTSYPARFPTLHLTLKSILDQTVRPDLVVLWLAHEDVAALPAEVGALEGDRFEVRPCDDLRNFKKILPALAAFPDAFILICDDDTYYPNDWLQRLVDAYDPRERSILCHRAHRLTYTPEGEVAPYREWQRNVADAASAMPSDDLLATGNGGVLYPPGSLPPQTADLDLIRKLSETSDDIWLFFMRRQANWLAKRVPGRKSNFVDWPGTQTQALWTFHRTGKKDEHIQDMSRHFGVP